MIHLGIPENNNSYCGIFSSNLRQGDIITWETPPYDRDVKNLCVECDGLRRKQQEDIRLKHMEDWNNRPPRQKFHDWLIGWSRLGEDQMGIIGDLMLTVGTFGTALIVKRVAKYLLKVGL